MNALRTLLVAGFALASATVMADQAGPDLLVVMNGSGKVERYDGKTGKWQGTFIYGVFKPCGAAWGPDGNLYLSTGALNGPGKVKRYDGRTGAFLGDFVSYKSGEKGYLARATGLAFHEGDLFVAGCDNGKIVRYNGKTGKWIADFASGSVVGITQIRFHQGTLYATDFPTCSIRKFRATDGAPQGNATALAGFSPWGLAFDAQGRLYWSGSNQTIQRFDGQRNTTWAGGDGGLKTPLWLDIGPDGNLYSSSWAGNSVDVWDLGTPGKRLRRITGSEVRGPVGLVATTHPMPQRRVVRIGDWDDQKPAPAGQGISPRSETPISPTQPPRSRIRLEALTDAPLVTSLGWDTEGGDRARLNLLRAPLELKIQIGQTWHSANEFTTSCQTSDGQRLRYQISAGPAIVLTWELRTDAGALSMNFAVQGSQHEQVRAMALVFPFDSHLAATTAIGSEWTKEGMLRLPAIISAPDLGQMRLSCPAHPGLLAQLEGSRIEQWVDLRLELPRPGATGYVLEFRPVLLPTPNGVQDAARWAAARRGWFNLVQVNAGRGNEPGREPAPSGVWANNVLSDPVSCTIYWLGEHALLSPQLAPGVSLPPLLRRTIDYWLDEKTSPEGQVFYVVGPTKVMDSNPAILIGAWCYVEASGDLDWLKRRMEKLERLAAFMENRDIDGDGLIESVESGNRGTHTFGDTAWDTYSSGHKNAYVNALAFRAFRCLSCLESRLARAEKQSHYRQRADRIKAVYQKTFFNPETGWLGWWRSRDGMLHDVWSDVTTDIAVMYGLVDRDQGRRMLDAYWAQLQKSGFRRFDLGVPLNIRPVHRDDQFAEWGGKKEDGSDTFGKYLNGGCCVSNTYFFLAANYLVGNRQRADTVLDAMLRRQQQGVFPNGGGFQNGVIDRYPEGAEFFDWQGNTCGYEGHLVYSWTFLQTIPLREPKLYQRVFGPIMD